MTTQSGSTSRSLGSAFAAALLALGLGACAAAPAGPSVAEPAAVDVMAESTDEVPPCCRVPLLEALAAESPSGIEFTSVRLSGADTLIDVRMRVVDARLAAPLFDRRNAAHLVEESTGLQANVPVPGKIGPLRQTITGDLPKEGRIYFLLFGNPDRRIRSGDRVRVEIGEYRSEPLAVM